MFKMPLEQRMPSGVDMTTFIDVMKTEDNAKFEEMFMTQDEPLQFIPSDYDTENSEEVYNFATDLLQTETLSPRQFQMLQRMFAGTGFQKKHGHHEGQFRREHFDT